MDSKITAFFILLSFTGIQQCTAINRGLPESYPVHRIKCFECYGRSSEECDSKTDTCEGVWCVKGADPIRGAIYKGRGCTDVSPITWNTNGCTTTNVNGETVKNCYCRNQAFCNSAEKIGMTSATQVLVITTSIGLCIMFQLMKIYY